MKTKLAEKSRFFWGLGLVILGLCAALLSVDRSGSVWLSSSAYAQDARGPAQGGAANPLMPPEREYAMKIKAPFTVAGVGDFIVRTPVGPLADPNFQNLVQHLRDADLGIGDMEGTLLDFDNFPNPIGGGAPKLALADIKNMGIKMMLTANNHSMDGGVPGMYETIRLLDEGGIAHAGTGRNLQEARAASFYTTPKGTVGLVGVFTIDPTSGPAPASTSSATYRTGDTGGAPGVNGLRVTPYYTVTSEQMDGLRKIRDAVYARRDEVPDPVPPLAANDPTDRIELFGSSYRMGAKAGDVGYTMNPNDLKEILRSVRNAKAYADFMIVMVHCHQANYSFQTYTFDNDTPDFLVDFAHQAIDAGADEFFANGVHTLRGVEIYKGKPIFYGVSNWINQLGQSSEPQNPGGDLTVAETANRPYNGQGLLLATQPDNEEALLGTSRFEDGKLVEVRIYPADLGRDEKRPLSHKGTPMTPSPEVAREILEKVQRISKRFGTNISIENNIGVIHVASAGKQQLEGRLQAQ